MRMLSHDALIEARRIYDILDAAMDLRRRGHEAQAWATLGEAHALSLSQRPILEDVIAAQRQAAQACDLPQGPALGLRVEAAEHPNPANDHSTPSAQPAPVGGGL